MRQQTIVTLLGTRGSVPVSGSEFLYYGGNTSCVLVRMGGEVILLDAGTGMLSLNDELIRDTDRVNLFLTHAHIDHLQGLPISSLCYRARPQVTIYAVPRGGNSAREQVETLMNPPLWPVGVSVFDEGVSFHDLIGEQHAIGAVRVEWMEGCHPGGSTVYRFSCGETSVVYATDFEHGDECSQQLAAFAGDCSLLIYDAQYLDSEYEEKRGWGHSTWREGVRLSKACRAARTIFVHHDPKRTDEALDSIGNLLPSGCSFGRCGEEVVL